MKRIVFLLIVVFLLFACVFNSASYDARLQNWVGQSENSLISAWGKPTLQRVMTDNQKVLTYIRYRNIFVPTEYFYNMPMWDADDMLYTPFFGEYAMSGYDQVQDQSFEGVCQTSFWVTNNIITSYQWNGDACL